MNRVIPQLHTVSEVYRQPESWFCNWGQMQRKFGHCHKFGMSNPRFDSCYDPCLLMNQYKCSMKGRTHLLTRCWTQSERVSILLLLLRPHSAPSPLPSPTNAMKAKRGFCLWPQLYVSATSDADRCRFSGLVFSLRLYNVHIHVDSQCDEQQTQRSVRESPLLWTITFP